MRSAPFARQVDLVLARRAPRDFVLTLGPTPVVYRALGAPDAALVMTQSTLRKIAQRHGIAVPTIKTLPSLLKAPVLVFRSATDPAALVAALGAHNANGHGLIAALHPDRWHKHTRVNWVASVYGKNRQAWFAEQVAAGRLLYTNKDRALPWPPSARLRLPGEVAATGPIPTLPHTRPEVKGASAPETKEKGPSHENK
ncbi:MAG: hypothetical protein JKP92_08420 [Alphaproteobacteria bacterium]|jgi:hypothetical protein|nr:hypothetical protein [Alphaproteobacteria bacterium]